MDIAGVVALIACAVSICAKMLFSFRLHSLERIHEQESHNHQAAQNELFQAQQKRKHMEAEQRQLEARRTATQRNIDKIAKTLKELQGRKKADDEVRAYQKEMLHGKKPH